MRIETFSGHSIEPWLDAVAELRIRVFRDWPYLYAGDHGYEREYLRHFQSSSMSVFVVVFTGDGQVVGCSTGLPIGEAHEEFRQPFRQAGYPLDRTFYFGESVLEPKLRGRGVGHIFFDRREDHARQLGHELTTFCAVVRPDDHPLKPADYQPLDGFWRKRGYEPSPALTTQFAWQDVDEREETDKPMQFWIKRL